MFFGWLGVLFGLLGVLGIEHIVTFALLQMVVQGQYAVHVRDMHSCSRVCSDPSTDSLVTQGHVILYEWCTSRTWISLMHILEQE